MEFEYDQKNVLYVRIDRKRKFLGTIFLRALGSAFGGEDILRTFYTVDRLVDQRQEAFLDSGSGEREADESARHEAGAQHQVKSGDEIAHSGRKINTPAS